MRLGVPWLGDGRNVRDDEKKANCKQTPTAVGGFRAPVLLEPSNLAVD